MSAAEGGLLQASGTAPRHGLMAGMVLALAVALVGVLAWRLVDSEHNQLQLARGEAQLQSLALSTTFETALEFTERSLASLASDLATDREDTLTEAHFRGLLVRSPHLLDLRFKGGNGWPDIRGGLRPVDGGQFAWLAPMIAEARIAGYGVEDGVLWFYRHVRNPDGESMGTLLAGIDQDYFREIFAQIPGPPRSAAALVGPDETILIDLGNTTAGTHLGNARAFAGLDESASTVAGVRTLQGEDGGIVVLQQLRTHPFRVMQAIPASFLEQRNSGQVLATVVAGGLLLLLSGVFVATWLRGAREHERVLNDLNRLNAAIEQTPTTVLIADRDARIVYANPEFTRASGYTLAEALGRNPGFLKSGLTPPETYRELWSTLKRGLPWRGSLVNRRKNGSVYVEDAVIAPMVDLSGEVTHFFAVKTDITERQAAEEAVADHKQRLERIIRGTRAGTWELEIATGRLATNRRWCEICGVAQEPFDARTLDDWLALMHDGDRLLFRRELDRHLGGATDYFDCEVRLRRRDPTHAWVLVRGQVCQRSDGGQPIAIAGTQLDISARKLAEQRLQESEARYRSVVDGVREIIFQCDREHRLSFLNHAWRQVTGLEIAVNLGRRADEFSDEAGRQTWAEAFECLLSGARESFSAELRIADASGNWRQCELYASPTRDENGRIVGISGTLDDITERCLARQRLQLAASVFTHAREGIVITDRNACIVDVNSAFSRITGYAREEVLGRNPRLLASGRQTSEFYDEMWRRLTAQGHWEGEVWNRRKGGEVYASLLSISAVGDPSGELLHYVGHAYDITPLKEHEARLERIAHYDALTGLPNRVLLHDRLQQAMAHAQRRQCVLAVAYLDLDGFKQVNDQYGHNAGDELLVSVANHMRKAVRAEDTVARLGGDEFVALLVDLPDLQAALPLIDRLLEAASRNINDGGRVLQVSGSIGITFYPQQGEHDPDQLLRQADLAMYQAKLAGKNRFHVFDAEQDRSAKGRHEVLEQIRQAIDNDEFVLHYQPQVNMRSGEVIGVEALIRWRHPKRGELPPAAFLPEVSDHPLAARIDEWVIRKALWQAGQWRRQGLDLQVAINVTPHCLQDAHCADRLRRLLQESPDFLPGRIELEVVETSALEDMVHVAEVIQTCLAMGVGFALDDFGTGYSSLTYLKRLPASRLKIDQSFVRDMLDDPDDLAILEGVLGLASAFRRAVIAEGVETMEHGLLLLKLGCEHAQGYGISRPMPAEAVPGWVDSWRPHPHWQAQLPISRDKLPVLFAQVEHRAWIRRLERYIHGQQGEPPPLDPKECRFGRWLDDGGRRLMPVGIPGDALQRLHEQIHVCASEVHALVTNGQADDARGRVDHIHGLRDDLLSQLDAVMTSSREG